MKKFLFCALAVMAMVFSSCSNDNDREGTFNFFLQRQSTVTGTRLQAIDAIVSDNSYFAQHTFQYTGKYSECVSEAIDDFLDECKSLDEKQICSYIEYGEYYRINLWCADPANNLVGYVWYQDRAVNE